MHGYLRRDLEPILTERLHDFPAVALLGPRQCGKTTLARRLVETWDDAVYLDLERPSDRRKLQQPELYFESQRARHGVRLFCLDEIQLVPELFSVLRSLIDEDGRNGQFLLLGSASRELIRQTSESLAGRIVFLELTPLVGRELDIGDRPGLGRYWLRGGFPRSVLARSDAASLVWRESFVRTFLEQDIPLLGFGIPAESLRRLWRMLAHLHGQQLNASRLGESLGVSHTTIRSYIDLLAQTFMIRRLEPYIANVKKRLVKSPRVYVRDSGILHALLEIATDDELLGHPVLGASWEGLVIENAIQALPDWNASFYRTRQGAELDLVLARGRSSIAIECKASAAPTVTRGFWKAIEDVQPQQVYVVAPVNQGYPLREGVEVMPLDALVAALQQD